MLDLIELGEMIRAARKGRGLSQNDLVARSGVSRSRIDALENGRIPEIGFKNLVRIMNAVGLDFRVTDANQSRPTLDDLVEEEESQNAARLG